MMNNDLIHDIKTRLDLRELVEAELGPGKRAGQTVRWRCPFHQGDNPTAFAVERGRFRCWACEAKGDLLAWLQQYHGLDFRAALERAAELAGVSHGVNDPAGHGGGAAGHGDARPTETSITCGSGIPMPLATHLETYYPVSYRILIPNYAQSGRRTWRVGRSCQAKSGAKPTVTRGLLRPYLNPT
jgi:hypothetical protein